MSPDRLRVLWLYHSGVVSAWRQGRMQALAAEGVDVTAVVPHRWNEGGAVVQVATGPGEDVVRAATAGHHPFRFVSNPIPLWRVLGRGGFDVIDVHEEPASLAMAEALALARWAGVSAPMVAYSAQNILKRYPPPFRWWEKLALRRLSAIHTCTDEVEGVLRAKGFTGEVVNLGLGIDVERFTPESDTSAADGKFRVGYVGRIEERKGIFTLLAAISKVPAAVLTYVGAGPDEDRLRAGITARSLGDRVQVRGYVDHDDLPELYRGFDVLVAHSHDTPAWREQFGRVVVEAMASGVPVVVSDVGALAEVAGGAGIVTPEGDASRLAKALRELRQSDELRADLASRGLVRATHFSWATIAKRQAALYHRVARGAEVPQGAGA